ncbi:hypothetical protein COH21_008825 [Aspergillus flavus]|nr:hypothetical protein COH21_008825 [Aspergillus flavus]
MPSQAGRQPMLPPKGPKNSFPTSHEPEKKLRAIIDLEIPWNTETNDNPNNLKEPLRTRIDQENLEIERVEGVGTLGNNTGLSLAKEARRRATFVTIARKRFLHLQYKRRNKKKKWVRFTEKDQDDIEAGNNTIHSADIVEDAHFYKGENARQDTCSR